MYTTMTYYYVVHIKMDFQKINLYFIFIDYLTKRNIWFHLVEEHLYSVMGFIIDSYILHYSCKCILSCYRRGVGRWWV